MLDSTSISAFSKAIDVFNEYLAAVIDAIYANPVERIMIYALVSAGIYFTVKTRAVQFRLFPHMLKSMLVSRKNSRWNFFFSSFRNRFSFTRRYRQYCRCCHCFGSGWAGLFWMWIIALFGMATAFIEAVLAQLYKIPALDGTFRGGLLIILKGFRIASMGQSFCFYAHLLFAFSFNMVQANTIAAVTKAAFGIEGWIVGIILIAITVPVIFGGLRQLLKLLNFVTADGISIYSYGFSYYCG